MQKLLILQKIIRPLNIRHMNFHTMSDVINVLFAITELTDFSFELTNTKPPENSEWTAGIKVNGKGDGKYDADFLSLWKTDNKEEYASDRKAFKRKV